MKRFALFIALLAAIAFSSQRRAHGQFAGSRSGTQTMFGPRSMGTSMGPGRGTFTGSGGALGQRSAGLTPGGMLTGNERFLRGNQQGQFIGRDSQAVAGFFETMLGGRESNARSGDGFATSRRSSSNGTGRFDTQSRFRNDRRGDGERFRSGLQNDTTRGRTVPVRTEMRAAFVYRERAPAEVSASVASRLRRVLRLPAGAEPEVLMAERTATLRGVVASDEERTLAERLALLEPGVSRVQNELRVEAAP